MEVYVLVDKKQSAFLKVLGVICAITGVFAIVLAMLGEVVFWLVAALCFVGFYILTMCKYEYEYSYFDGEFRFARITNKNARKQFDSYLIEDVQVLAPIMDRSVHSYLQQSGMKKRDYTTGNADARVYALVAKGQKGMELIAFEPDDRYLDEVCIKYRQKVVR